MKVETHDKRKEVLKLLSEGKKQSEVEKIINIDHAEFIELVGFLEDMNYIKIYKRGFIKLTEKGIAVELDLPKVEKGYVQTENSSLIKGLIDLFFMEYYFHRNKKQYQHYLLK
jgi:hypothetical protein